MLLARGCGHGHVAVLWTKSREERCIAGLHTEHSRRVVYLTSRSPFYGCRLTKWKEERLLLTLHDLVRAGRIHLSKEASGTAKPIRKI